jgi:nitrogen regulatory protein PII-like uncharacterized protein
MTNLRKGDQLSLTASITISLGNYQSLKPSATVTRTVGDDPEHDIREVSDELRLALHRSVVVEVQSLERMAAAIDEGGLDGLIHYCQTAIDDELEEQTSHSATRERRVKRCRVRKQLDPTQKDG